MTVPAKNEPAAIFTNLKLVTAIAVFDENIILGMALSINFIAPNERRRYQIVDASLFS